MQLTASAFGIPANNTPPDPNAQDPTKLPLCVEVFAKEALSSALPFPPSATTVGAAAQQGAAIAYRNAARNVAREAVVDIARYRTFLTRAAVLKSTPLSLAITGVVALGQGLVVEWSQAAKGQCRAY